MKTIFHTAAYLLLAAITAFGHGSMADPISRSYEVFLENPETPVTAAAKAAIAVAGTQPFYDWMEVRRQVPDYNYPSLIPDGQLPGVGLVKYAGLNLTRTDWPATKVVPGQRVCRYYATTTHDPSFFKAYLTKDGYNPLQPLKWSDLVEIPGGETATLNGSNYYMTLNLPARTGRHVLYVVWQRVDPVGEVFFSASDLDFGGIDYGATPSPVTAPAATNAASNSMTNNACCLEAKVAFSFVKQWTGGGQGTFNITNTSVDESTKGWSVEFDWPADITSLWDGVIVNKYGNHYVVQNANYNGAIPPGGTANFGFVANFSTADLQPTGIVFNGYTSAAPILSISTVALTNGMVGFPYSQTFTAAGGTGPYTWSLSSGTTPPGLTLSTAGVLSGIPSAATTASFTVQAKDVSLVTTTHAYSMTVSGGTVIAAPVVTSAASASGTVGSTFSYQIKATNNPTSFAATGLPSGLAVNAASGVITGTPTAAAVSTISLKASNSGGSGTKTLQLTVVAAKAPVITSAASASGTVGSTFSYQITATNNSTSFAATGLPSGLAVNAASGVITGTPTAAAVYTISLKASNSGGSGTKALKLTVVAAPVVVPTPTPTPSATPSPSPKATPSPTPLATPVSSSGYLSTKGNQIVDVSGNTVRITGVNWFGFETGNQVLHGLWSRDYHSMLDQVKSLGFNTLRIPFSNQMLASGAATSGINFNANPDLQGLTPIQCMDKVIAYAGQIGLKVFLDRHSSKADNFANEDLWYIPGDSYYTEAQWINDWVMLAKRYAGNTTVIGADLFNEPKKTATWGNSSPATDWNKAAERCANAILGANPNWLIIVEGVEKYNNQTTWWGGNLTGATQYPVMLNVANKLVYSAHDYPSSVFAQTWFSDATYPKNLSAVWNANWGYIFQKQTAPVLVGEFGSKLASASDQTWMKSLLSYMNGDLSLNGSSALSSGQKGMSWTYWSLNPNSGDTEGILNSDWTTVNTTKMDYLKASLAPLIGSPSGSGTATPSPMPVATPTPAPSVSPKPTATPSPTPLATPSPSPTPVTGGNAATTALFPNASVNFSVTSAWEGGFNGQVVISNTSSQTLTNWSLSFQMSPVISTIWSAGIVSQSGGNYVINAGSSTWNNSIAPGASATIGFTASPSLAGVAPKNIGLSVQVASTAPVVTPTPAPAVTPVATPMPSPTPLVVTTPTPAPTPVATPVTRPTPTPTPVVTPTPVQSTAFNYAEAVQKSLYFYNCQKLGKLPTNNMVPWRGDSALTDGIDNGIDLSGGYSDAGDHVKFGLPMASSMTLLAWGGIDNASGYQKSGQTKALLDVIRWGTDYLIKAHPSDNVFYGQVGTGSADHAFWGPPEVMTMARPSFALSTTKPGTEVAAESAATLASASILFRSSDPAYAELLLAHAKTLYNFADTYRGTYTGAIPDAASFYNSFSGYYDELVWGAAWLYRATGDLIYLNKAETLYSQNIAGKNLIWTHAWDDKSYGATILLAELTDKSIYKTSAEKWLNYWTVGNSAGGKVAYTSGGLAWLDQWGSLRYAANTAFLALIYADKVGDVGTRYHDFAKNQIDYILGKNPAARSYVVGFGNNPPVNPHHRGAHGSWSGDIASPVNNRHILYGALVGGPSSAADTSYTDDRSNYVCNEVALDYNAGFQGAVARLAQESTGTPLAQFPPASEAGTLGEQYFVQAAVNQQGSGFMEIRALLNNRSAFPAQGSTQFAFRYYLDLSTLYAAGYDASAITVTSNYIQNGTAASALQVYDAARHIYYVNVNFSGTLIQPGSGTSYWREAQFRMTLRQGVPSTAWNPAKDPSNAGLLNGGNNLTTTTKIPVYENGTLLTGFLP